MERTIKEKRLSSEKIRALVKKTKSVLGESGLDEFIAHIDMLELENSKLRACIKQINLAIKELD